MTDSCRNRRRRSGALLLVVLALLVLILLLGMSFLVLAMRFNKTAKSNLTFARSDRTSDERMLMESALLRILRGTNGSNSAAYGHSLLEDLYGNDGFQGVVKSVTPLANGQFLRLKFDGPKLDNHLFDGCIVTIVNSSGQYRSGRVVQFFGETNELIAEDLFTVDPGSRLIVNGYPFNAVDDDAELTINETARPYWSLPQRAAVERVYGATSELPEPDEAWDAIDLHNMALAKIPTTPTSEGIIPSFHRPRLINWWRHHEDVFRADSHEGQQLRQWAMFRPSVEFHPGFADVNPNFDPVSGPWDVDNDDDGIRDSVWVDFGLPSLTLPDGRRCKPLVAALILDMDGRLNLNAHGNLGQLSSQGVHAMPNREPAYGIRLKQSQPKGAGHGPAEVDLRFLFSGATAAKTFFDMRYAPMNASDFPTEHFQQPGIEGVADGLRHSLSLPRNAAGTQHVYLDRYGHPVFVKAKPVGENPYELSLLRQRSADQTFDYLDLEWLLRDGDYSMQDDSRLSQVLEPQTNSLLTTASFSIPTLPKRGKIGIVEILRERLVEHGVKPSQIEVQLGLMLPPEILRGEKMDLNRLFVVGPEEKRVVVTPTELPRNLMGRDAKWSFEDEMQYAKGLYARHLYCIAMTLLPEDIETDSLSKNEAVRLRARTMAQWAVNVVDFRDEDGICTPFEYDANPWDGWDVNGILKSSQLDSKGDRLEKDSDPSIDVVWGMERPEVLLTESLALHDRMVGDFEIGGMRRRTRMQQQVDNDLDQIRRPRGPLLLELHSPHSRHATQEGMPKPIAESAEDSNGTNGLYFHPPNSQPVLNLDKIETGAQGLRHPVWRVAISEWHGEKEKRSPLRLTQNTRGAGLTARCEPDKPSSMIDPSRPAFGNGTSYLARVRAALRQTSGLRADVLYGSCAWLLA